MVYKQKKSMIAGTDAVKKAKAKAKKSKEKQKNYLRIKGMEWDLNQKSKQNVA
jgi:aspartate/tyrosine/aromatic aminotransferase